VYACVNVSMFLVVVELVLCHSSVYVCVYVCGRVGAREGGRESTIHVRRNAVEQEGTDVKYVYVYIERRIATHCNTLQHTATHCNIATHNHAVERESTHVIYVCVHIERRIAMHCNTLQHTATLQHTVMQSSERVRMLWKCMYT